MTGFWISAAAMILLVAGLVVQAVRQADGSDAAAEGEADLAVYRDQLAEIDRDLARGVLASDEAQRLRLEVQRRMLSADRLRQGGTAQGHWTSRVFVVLALALCLGGAAAIYSDLGVLGYPDLPLQTRLAMADQTYLDRPHQAEAEAAQPPFVQSPEVEPELAAMIEQLRAAVAARPGDLVGLSLLARNEAALGNFVAARAAQDEVVALKAGQATGEDLARRMGIASRASRQQASRNTRPKADNRHRSPCRAPENHRSLLMRRDRTGFGGGWWWTARGSNPRPRRCERRALPAELSAQSASWWGVQDLNLRLPPCEDGTLPLS